MRMAPKQMIEAALVALAMVALVILPPGRVLAQDKENISVVWQMTETEAAAVEAKLDYEGEIRPVEGEEVRGAPLVVLVGLAVLPSLVDSVITFYRDLTQGGVIIDGSGETLEIRQDMDLPYGMIVVRGEDKLEVQNFRSTPKPADLSSAIAEAVKATAK